MGNIDGPEDDADAKKQTAATQRALKSAYFDTGMAHEEAKHLEKSLCALSPAMLKAIQNNAKVPTLLAVLESDECGDAAISVADWFERHDERIFPTPFAMLVLLQTLRHCHFVDTPSGEDPRITVDVHLFQWKRDQQKTQSSSSAVPAHPRRRPISTIERSEPQRLARKTPNKSSFVVAKSHDGKTLEPVRHRHSIPLPVGSTAKSIFASPPLTTPMSEITPLKAWYPNRQALDAVAGRLGVLMTLFDREEYKGVLRSLNGLRTEVIKRMQKDAAPTKGEFDDWQGRFRSAKRMRGSSYRPGPEIQEIWSDLGRLLSVDPNASPVARKKSPGRTAKKNTATNKGGPRRPVTRTPSSGAGAASSSAAAGGSDEDEDTETDEEAQSRDLFGGKAPRSHHLGGKEPRPRLQPLHGEDTRDDDDDDGDIVAQLTEQVRRITCILCDFESQHKITPLNRDLPVFCLFVWFAGCECITISTGASETINEQRYHCRI
jgi:hypothetical protein